MESGPALIITAFGRKADIAALRLLVSGTSLRRPRTVLDTARARWLIRQRFGSGFKITVIPATEGLAVNVQLVDGLHR